MTDLEIVLNFLERQWLPVSVKEAYDRLRTPPSRVEVMQAIGSAIVQAQRAEPRNLAAGADSPPETPWAV